MATKDLEPDTKVVVLSPEGIGIDKPATAMATILELTGSHTGEGTTHSRTYVPEPESYRLIRHCLSGGRGDRVWVRSAYMKAGISDWSNGFLGL